MVLKQTFLTKYVACKQSEAHFQLKCFTNVHEKSCEI